MIDIRALFAESDGFVRTLAPEIVSVDPARLRLDADPMWFNHLGGPHAAAIFGLGELTGFVVLLREFGDLVEAGAIPLVKDSSIAYSAVVVGPVVSTATLLGDPAGVRAALNDRGRATFPVEVRFVRESDAVEAAVATYTMALRQAER